MKCENTKERERERERQRAAYTHLYIELKRSLNARTRGSSDTWREYLRIVITKHIHDVRSGKKEIYNEAFSQETRLYTSKRIKEIKRKRVTENVLLLP